MSTFNWSTLANGQTIAFNPAVDQLNFEDSIFNSANLVIFDYFSSATTSTFTSLDGKAVTLLSAPGTLTSSNVTFASGGLFLYGDNTTVTLNDNSANTLIGGNFGDKLTGRSGA